MMHFRYHSFLLACALMFYSQNGHSGIKEHTHNYSTTLTLTNPPNKHSLDSLGIAGKVTDSVGSVIERVVITEKGTTNSTLSDVNGAYKISVNPSSVLVFLKSGFKTHEEQVNNRRELDVMLIAGSSQQEDGTQSGS